MAPVGYKLPPAEIQALLSTPRPPSIVVSPRGDVLLKARQERFTPLFELARPILRLGPTIVDRVHGAPRRLRYDSLSIVDLRTYADIPISLPGGIRLDLPRWSANGKYFAFSSVSSDGVRLWVVSRAQGAARLLTGVVLNASLGQPFVWMPDSLHLLCKLRIPSQAVRDAATPLGPLILDTATLRNGSLRAIPPALREPVFRGADALLSSQLALVNVLDGRVQLIGRPGQIHDAQPSQNGHLLRILRVSSIPTGAGEISVINESTEIWRLSGEQVARIAMRQIVTAGPVDATTAQTLTRRNFTWGQLPGGTTGLIFGELSEGSQDGSAAGHGGGERLMLWSEPFQTVPRVVFGANGFITQVASIGPGSLLYLREYDPRARTIRVNLLDLDGPGTWRRLWDVALAQVSGSRTRFMKQPLVQRAESPADRDNAIYLTGESADSANGGGYLDRLTLESLQRERIWTAESNRRQTVAAMLTSNGSRLLLHENEPTSVSNYLVSDRQGGTKVPIARVPRPNLSALGVRQQRMRYHRADGLPLYATLYTPANREKDRPLPLILWAYPKTYNDRAAAANQADDGKKLAPTAAERPEPVSLAMRGYAVMDRVSMPIIESDPHSFTEQLVESAQAAIKKAVAMGVADPERIGIAGHSFGAFATATLLAHTRLFRAGAALSGAYNRTLTPFGFQAERRTLWEAPEHYLAMSPFLQADRIDAPLLLVHGERDNNAGTAPIQSRFLFEAVQRTGGTARLVILPYEGHVYRARESVLHSAAEMLDWFDRYLKGGSAEALLRPTPPDAEG